MFSFRRIMLWFCLLLVVATPVLADTTLTVIDVGQGDAIWLHDDDGYDALIDAGPAASSQAVLDALGDIEDLDTVVWTHAHADHIGGMADVFSRYPVHEILWNGFDHDTPTFDDLMYWVSYYAIPLRTVRAGDTFGWGDCTAIVVHPDRQYNNDPNNSSVVIRLTCYGTRVLLTGDAEWDAEYAMLTAGQPIRSDILKVGHHGSTSSTHSLFLDAVQPQAAMISVGEDSNYDHPSPVVLERLDDRGISTYRTDEDGSIVVHIGPGGYTIHTSHRTYPEQVLALPLILQQFVPTVPVPTIGPSATATFTLAPTETPTWTPTEMAPCPCNHDTLNCDYFDTQGEAQQCYEYCLQQEGDDVHGLDGNNNGVACEMLP
jgi:competence protein ComEC